MPSCRLSFPAAYSALFRTAHIWHPLNYIACLLTLLFVVAAVGCCGWGVGPLELYFWEIVANFLRIAKLNFASAPRCMASAIAARAVDQAVPQQRPQYTRQQPKEKPPAPLENPTRHMVTTYNCRHHRGLLYGLALLARFSCIYYFSLFWPGHSSTRMFGCCPISRLDVGFLFLCLAANLGKRCQCSKHSFYYIPG